MAGMAAKCGLRFSEKIGEYKWDLEKVALKLEEVKDSCAIHMRALNLTRQAWLSCQPPNIEAAISDHWIKPPGCE